ncbi:DUF4249 domain-containing protein [Desertivirga brevis]|uniref:DUF4249 domain-containing protein n=1 Tax=Desertivirga brevis TaxID=2810310 RepID=UPI001A95E89B|nr:DUF4249 domain-containing protein [Pedobacter sp. SYSU D00873]
MKTLNIILTLLIAILFSSCEDVIDIKAPDGQDALVVEGWLTNRAQNHYVKLYLTKKLSDNSPYPAVTGAKLVLKDNDGNSETLQETSAGTYEIKTMKSVVGKTYTLSIESTKGNYEAIAVTPKLSLVPDSLSFKFEPKSAMYDKEGYYPRFYGQETEGKGDYIQVRLYRNGKYMNMDGDFNLFSDEFVDGNYIDNAELNVNEPFVKGEMVKGEVWSLSEHAFNFWTDIQTQLQNGQIFATAFANTRTNITKKGNTTLNVVGYFGSSIVQSVERKVE